MGPGSDFGSWAVESLETYANRRGEPATCRVEHSTAVAQRPASATVRVPYLPSHVRTYQLKPKRRPLSAASYMRSTFAIDSALPARATNPTPQQQEQQRRRRFRGRASWQPEAHLEDAKYVLEKDACQGRNDRFHVSVVPRPRQGFGVRTSTAGKKRVCTSGGGGGGKAGRAQPRNTGSNRGTSRRPASAPVRFFGRRSVSSPGCESSAAPDVHGRHGDEQPRRATKRRPGPALTGNLAHQNQAHDIQRYLSDDQRRGGSPLPPAAWGVRPTSAPPIPAESLTGCSEQIGRTYEEVVVCRGSHFVVKGSAARRNKQQRHSSGGLDDHWQQGEGLGGIGRNEPELLQGASSSGLWVRGGWNQGGGEDAGDRNQLGLAINPSPWGAFVGGPPAEKTKLGRARKRPSSAPRTLSTTTSPNPGVGVGSLRAKARPSSAHAASPSRNITTEVFVTTGYSCGKEDGSGSKAERGAERAIQDSACQSSRSERPVSAVDRVELGGESDGGMDAGRPREANRARSSKSNCRHNKGWGRLSLEGATVVAFSQALPIGQARSHRGSKKKSGPKCKAVERVAAPTFFGPSTSRGTTYDAPSPPSVVQPPPPAPPPPPPRLSLATSTQQVLGLFGSALLPAGNGTKLPGNWQNKRSELQAREQGRPQSQGRQQRKATSEVRTTKYRVERSVDGHSFNAAPVVLDRRIIGAGEENGLRHVRATGLVGKALRVPKHTSIQSQQQQQQQQATTPSAKREEQRRPIFGLSEDQ